MIYLIRHAKTINNINKIVQGRTDTDLSNEGINETINFSKELKKLNISFDTFYASPLKRAYKTLEIIMDNLGYNKTLIQIDESLNERYFGAAEGINYESEITQYQICNDYFNGMELNKDLEKRVYDGILNIAKANINKNVMIVSHSHAIKAFIRNLIKNYPYLGSTHNLNMNIFSFNGKTFEVVELDKDLI